MEVPGFSVILAVNDTCTGNPVCSDELNREDESPVRHADSASRALKSQEPFRMFYLPGDIPWFRPASPVVVTRCQHQLGCFFGLEPAPDSGPGAVSAASVCPDGQNENFAAPGIHEYRGIANSVLGLRKPAPFTHIQGDAHGFPGYTSVGTAADSDVNIVLQVETRNMSDIIYADQ